MASNFAAICMILIYEIVKFVYGHCSLNVFIVLHENSLNTNIFQKTFSLSKSSLCGRVTGVQSWLKSHTLAVILAVFEPPPTPSKKDGIRNGEKVNSGKSCSQTHDLCETGAVFYQLTSQLGAGYFVSS